jgi:hypothetical protein
MPQEIITTRLAELSPNYRDFIESDFTGEAAQTFGEASGFDQRKIEILENAFAFYLLLFFDEQITISFIARNCDISEEDATLLFTAMRATLPEGLDAMVQAETAPQTTLGSEIAETEKALENIQGIRTMAGDMKEAQTNVPTHQSSQSDLIQPSTPTPPPTGTRWETDK